MKQSKAIATRKLVEKGSATYTLTEAACNPSLMPTMHYDGSLIEYKTRINWHGVTMLARQALYDYEQYNPDNAPNLWAAIRQKDGIRYIEVNMAAELAFGYGEKGWWDNKLYESRMEGNPYTPATAPTVWVEVTE